MKMSNIKVLLSIIAILAIINSVLLKKRKRISAKSENTNRLLAKYANMIDPVIKDDKYNKNLFTKDLKPDTNETDKILLTKSLIAGVLRMLNVPEDKIDERFTKITNDEIVKIMKILIKFLKNTSHVEVLKSISEFNFEGLDLNQISPGSIMGVIQYLQKHIMIHGRRK